MSGGIGGVGNGNLVVASHGRDAKLLKLPAQAFQLASPDVFTWAGWGHMPLSALDRDEEPLIP